MTAFRETSIFLGLLEGGMLEGVGHAAHIGSYIISKLILKAPVLRPVSMPASEIIMAQAHAGLLSVLPFTAMTCKNLACPQDQAHRHKNIGCKRAQPT